MSGFFKVLSISLATGVFAAPASLSIRQEALPAQEPAAWDSGAVTQYPIHSSCNATQAHQLALGLNETILLADLAREHILRWGNSSETYQKYFGDLPPYEAIGAYEIIVNGDKGSVLFRCDNPDGNCAIEGTACVEVQFISGQRADHNCRLRRSLERFQRDRRDRHLRLELRDSSFAVADVRPWIYRRRVKDQHFLGLGPHAPAVPHPSDRRRVHRTFHRGPRRSDCSCRRRHNRVHPR